MEPIKLVSPKGHLETVTDPVRANNLLTAFGYSRYVEPEEPEAKPESPTKRPAPKVEPKGDDK